MPLELGNWWAKPVANRVRARLRDFAGTRRGMSGFGFTGTAFGRAPFRRRLRGSDARLWAAAGARRRQGGPP
jgi:hypothetical protein